MAQEINTTTTATTSTSADIVVTRNPNGYNSWDCLLKFQGSTFFCSCGRNGIIDASEKIEGDSFTPAGSYPLRRVFYRSDRITPEISTYIESQPTKTTDGWVDDANSVSYNQYVVLTPDATTDYLSYENLWLSTNSYDLMAVIGYNDDPVENGRGSAIFFHTTANTTAASDSTSPPPLLGPTAGCISLELQDLTWVLARVLENTRMNIIAAEDIAIEPPV